MKGGKVSLHTVKPPEKQQTNGKSRHGGGEYFEIIAFTLETTENQA